MSAGSDLPVAPAESLSSRIRYSAGHLDFSNDAPEARNTTLFQKKVVPIPYFAGVGGYSIYSSDQ